MDKSIEELMVELGCNDNRISAEHINSQIAQVDFKTIELCGKKVMYCGIKMNNGFVVTAEPATCIDPENWRDEIGRKVSFDNTYNRLYALEAYRTMGVADD